MERDFKYEFRMTYPFIACTDETIVNAHELTEGMPDDLKLDLMKDYILSNGIEEGVTL